MNKTLQEQYNLIKEGKGNKQQFFKSARHIFPDLITPVNTFEDTVRILKNRGIITEGIGGLVTKGKTPDWHSIFKENMIKEYGEDSGGQDMTYGMYNRSTTKKDQGNQEFIKYGKEAYYDDIPFEACPYESGYNEYYKADLAKLWQMGWNMAKEDEENINSIKEEKEVKVGDTIKHKLTGAEFEVTKISGNNIEGKYTKVGDLEGKVKVGDINKTNKNLIGKTYDLLSEAKKVKAVEKEPTKDVVDMETKDYDYKDKKNYDNVFGQEFLKGFYTEMQDEKNKDKDVDELRAIVAKNLAKDINHYVKDGQFGVKGVGYTTEAPGLGTPKEAKGKHKSSGYGDLKEGKIPAENRNTYYYGSLVKKMKKDGKNKEEIRQFFKDEKVDSELIDSILTRMFLDTKSLNNSDLKESILRSQIHILIKEILSETSTNDFSKYSNDAITDMIINLSRFKGNEKEIQAAKAELARRKDKKK